jgi:hypothetical protein
MIGSSGSERGAQTADASQCSEEIGNVWETRREAQRGLYGVNYILRHWVLTSGAPSSRSNLHKY